MEIEYRKISELKYYPGNPRKITDEMLEKLKNSIKEFGVVDPLVINKDNEVIGGNQRLKAMKELDIEEAPVVVISLSKDKEKALNLALNKIQGEWDEELLKEFIIDLSVEDIELTGFDDVELSEIRDSGIEAKEDEYEIPEDLLARSQHGDIYQLGIHRLMCGDTTDLKDVERLMDGKLAGMVYTDPPYGVDYEGIGKNTSVKIVGDTFDAVRPLLKASFNNMFKVCRDGAVVYVWHGSSSGDVDVISREELINAGFLITARIVWAKFNATMGWNDYRHRYETMWYGWKKDHKFYGDRAQTDVWEASKGLTSAYLHPTQKPIELAFRAIKNSTVPEDIILDLFGGSGSTLIAAEQLGRSCYMMELEPHYCDVIIDRWETYTGQKAAKL